MPRIGNILVTTHNDNSESLVEWTKAMCLASAQFDIVELDKSGLIDGVMVQWYSINALRRATRYALAAHGLWAMHTFRIADGRCVIRGEVRHATSNEFVASELVLPITSDNLEATAIERRAAKALGDGILQVITEEQVQADPAEIASRGSGAEEMVSRQQASYAVAKDKALGLKQENEVGPFLAKVKKQEQLGNLPAGSLEKLRAICNQSFPVKEEEQ